MSWKEYFHKNKIKIYFIFILFILTLVSTYLFLDFNEQRTGATLHDPLLEIIPSKDVSLILFVLTYLGSITGIIYCLRNPLLAVHAAITYMLLLWFRMLCMYFTPLNPPSEIIPLRDVFLELTFYSGKANLKDLFFSGHTATMVMFFFLSRTKYMKLYFFILSIFIGLLVLIQHAHYTIDVIMAPIAAYIVYKVGKFLTEKYFIEKTNFN